MATTPEAEPIIPPMEPQQIQPDRGITEIQQLTLQHAGNGIKPVNANPDGANVNAQQQQQQQQQQ